MPQTNRSRTPLYLLLFSAMLLVPTRILLELYYIDQETGFYRVDGALVLVFNICVAVAVLAMSLVTFLPPGREIGPLRTDKKLVLPGILALGCTLASAYSAVSGFVRYGEDFVVNGKVIFNMPFFLAIIGMLVALASAVVIGNLGWYMLHGNLTGLEPPAVLVLPVLHSTFILVDSFLKNTVTVNVSNNMFEVLFLCTLILFTMALSRIAGGVKVQKGRRLLLFSGYAGTLLGLLWVVPKVVYGLRVSLPFPQIFDERVPLYLVAICFMFTFTVSLMPLPVKTMHKQL